MNGVELEEKLRNIWPGIKVLFMTGYTEDILEEARREGREYKFLHKPFTPQELGRRVREVLES